MSNNRTEHIDPAQRASPTAVTGPSVSPSSSSSGRVHPSPHPASANVGGHQRTSDMSRAPPATFLPHLRGHTPSDLRRYTRRTFSIPKMRRSISEHRRRSQKGKTAGQRACLSIFGRAVAVRRSGCSSLLFHSVRWRFEHPQEHSVAPRRQHWCADPRGAARSGCRRLDAFPPAPASAAAGVQAHQLAVGVRGTEGVARAVRVAVGVVRAGSGGGAPPEAGDSRAGAAEQPDPVGPR